MTKHGFSRSHAWMWELDHKESWEPKELMLLNCGVGEDSRVPWTARTSNQSILKDISPEYSLEGLMLKLKLQYFGSWCEELTHWKRPWCWERLKAGGEGDDRRWDGWMASLIQWMSVWANSGRWWRPGKPGVLQSMRLQSQTQLPEWTITTNYLITSQSVQLLIKNWEWLQHCNQCWLKSHDLSPQYPGIDTIKQTILRK